MGGFFLRSHDYSKSSLSRITKQTNPIETGLLANTVIRKSTGFFPRLLSVGLTQVINSLRSRKKSDHNVVKFSHELNSTLDIHDSFLIYSRIKAKDFCISRLAEYTSITIHGTGFYQITIHKNTVSRRHESTIRELTNRRLLHYDDDVRVRV